MTDEELIERLRDADLYNAEHYERDPLHKQAADRIEALKAKLAQAVEALGLIVVDNTWGLEHETYMKCRTTLAEISSHNKGESHE